SRFRNRATGLTSSRRPTGRSSSRGRRSSPSRWTPTPRSSGGSARRRPSSCRWSPRAPPRSPRPTGCSRGRRGRPPLATRSSSSTARDTSAPAGFRAAGARAGTTWPPCAARSTSSTRNSARARPRTSTSIRLWRAVLLMNLALALGLMLGYLAWGRQLVGLELELSTARQQAAALTRTWTVRGIVRAILPQANIVILTHEDIPGFMASMTMGFLVKDPALYQGLDIGETVRFTLTGTPPNVVITAIERETP